jgi:Fur family ferric uptake transcriptional regulator
MTGPSERQSMRIESLCVEHGLRMTEQRRIIARVLSEATDHPDVDELYRRITSIDDRISLSTVYRTVKLLESMGIIERHDFGAGRARYERSEAAHHDHLVDVDTGNVIEFHNEEIERIQERIARELGYRLIGHRLELYGVRIEKKPQNP